jgi:asparagine N-glycosylation enzyme membrane subunit Stt3
MAITLRSTKGSLLTYNELDTNFTTPYISSSIDGNTLSLFSHGTGSFTAVTHSLQIGNLYKESVSGSNTYTITHSLDEDYPIVQAYNSSKEQVVPGTVLSNNTSSISVTFDTTFTGTIVVKK